MESKKMVLMTLQRKNRDPDVENGLVGTLEGGGGGLTERVASKHAHYHAQKRQLAAGSCVTELSSALCVT